VDQTPGVDEVLVADELHKRFGANTAVEGVSLRVRRGERVGVVGPNGAGKTTTLLMLLGAVEPDSGRVELVGHPLPAGRSAAMASVGFAAGYLPLPERMTVRETLELFADLHGVPDRRGAIEAVVEELSIQRLMDRRTEELSSGQRTLAGIAKAVLHRPRLVVLDEPTASLDPDVAIRVRDRLAHLNAEHDVTLLLTSHDMREVERLTDRVVFLRAGCIIADGAPSQVVAEHGHRDLESMFLAEARRLREEEV
jgi:ABC-2 type transport system ATP-binding protein